MFVVFDLDGTLSCAKHRHHHIENFDLDGGVAGAVDWDAFYRSCVDDPPIVPIINTLIGLRAAGARVEIWTGRSDLVRPETERWLMKHAVPHYLLKHMRKHGDHRPDTELKLEFLSACDSVPDLIFEDRARVVRLWRELGIRVCQVDEGLF